MMRRFALMLLTIITLCCRFGKADEPRWDVNTPPGDRQQIEINVNEGTWMSLDISPDGQTLVFDLLGDIYALPIEGGLAKPLTSGMAWDMQPKFSPDGDLIAFSSDANGSHDIWLMDRSGKQKYALTNQSLHPISNPAWSPDGRFLVARKHIASESSSDAGEIWLYQRASENSERVLPAMPQHFNRGEPVFAPDGNEIYFSQGSIHSEISRNNPQVHAEIYQIRSVNRETGELTDQINGPGGAVRPTPSPDGKKIAFVRRLNQQTSLMVKDMTTGELSPVYQLLDRDLQESAASFGVYPAFAWTPDSRDLIFWAQGKIKRLNTQTLAVKDIPFQVKHRREIRAALRFPFTVTQDQFDVNMLRWVTVSPDAKRVVFQALGYLYVRELPDGNPKRLTRQTSHFEFFPAFSADGKWIVYSTWHDQQLGHIRKVRATGGRSITLTRQPGHYRQPRFSPDGKTIIYRQSKGHSIISPLYSERSGIFRMDEDGRQVRPVTRLGHNAHFGQRSDRIFVTRNNQEGDLKQQVLLEMDLDGKQTVERLSIPGASQYRVSPDNRWIAYVKNNRVYVSPFNSRSGSNVANKNSTAKDSVGSASGKQSQTLTSRGVSEFAGENLNWSRQGDAVHWSVGPNLYRQPISLSQLPISKAELSQREPQQQQADFQPNQPLVTHLAFRTESDVPRGSYYLSGARIITMRNNEVIEQGDIIIEGNRITAIGPSGSVTVPRGARRLNLAGKTIIPGIIDAHWQGTQSVENIIPQQNWINFATLALGVTSVHHPSGDPLNQLSASELAKKGRITAPRIFSTITLFDDPNTFATEGLGSSNTLFESLKRLTSPGTLAVKNNPRLNRAQRQQLLEAARQLKLTVLADDNALLAQKLTLIVDGYSGIEGAMPVAELYNDIEQLWSQSRVGYTPILSIAPGGLRGEDFWYQKSNVWQHQRLTRFVPQSVLWPRSIRRIMAPDSDYGHFAAAKVAAKLQAIGVDVNLGTHGQREGLGAHWEMWMLAQGGMPPHKVLQTATLNSAKYLGLERDLGSLEKGKLADLVILNHNPLDDIFSTDQVDMVMLNGRLFDGETMNQVGNHPKTREPFYFER